MCCLRSVHTLAALCNNYRSAALRLVVFQIVIKTVVVTSTAQRRVVQSISERGVIF